SSMMAFVACPSELKEYLKSAAPTVIFSGPTPVASLATAQTGLRLNLVKGDEVRADLYQKTARVLAGIAALGLPLMNTSGFPIVEVPLGDPAVADVANDHLFDRGVLVTPAPFPVVPRDQVGFRIQVTAANTDADLDHLLTVLAEVAEIVSSGAVTSLQPAG
nr:aminotransferase class I/II-fold pyridoxal phosphate-dependent enzyme [Micromonospora sp. DSM 115978]